MKHTKGPWKVEDIRPLRAYSEKVESHYRIDGLDFSPALIMGDGTENRGLALANAHLIASAPELLEACKDAFSEMMGSDRFWFTRGEKQSIGKSLEQAIAKAEGRDEK